jgi:hypothetical protein
LATRDKSRPLLEIRLTEGLAERNRLPLEHVIRVLTEVKGMIEEAGARLRRAGGQNPDVDFGLELVAGFQRGSVKAQIQVTRNLALGASAIGEILETVNRLGPPKRTSQKRAANVAVPPGDFDPRLVTRLNNIAKVQEIDRTTMRLALRVDGHRETAKFDKAAVKVAANLRTANFGVSGLTLFGKLRELRDKTDEDDESQGFWGELVRDNGEIWRIEFRPSDAQRAAALFRRQVYVTGDATHYKALNPKIKATDFGPDEERDYEAAFDRLYGGSEELAGADPAKLLHELRGETTE